MGEEVAVKCQSFNGCSLRLPQARGCAPIQGLQIKHRPASAICWFCRNWIASSRTSILSTSKSSLAHVRVGHLYRICSQIDARAPTPASHTPSKGDVPLFAAFWFRPTRRKASIITAGPIASHMGSRSPQGRKTCTRIERSTIRPPRRSDGTARIDHDYRRLRSSCTSQPFMI